LPSPRATAAHSTPQCHDHRSLEGRALTSGHRQQVRPGDPAATVLAAGRQPGLLIGRPPPLQDADPWVQPMA
jgi:hypothetical protein